MDDKNKQSRFILQHSEKQNNWVCTDQLNKIVVTFEHGKFNDTQNYTLLEDFDNANVMQLAKIAAEIGDWLRDNHYDKIF